MCVLGKYSILLLFIAHRLLTIKASDYAIPVQVEQDG